MRHSTIRRFAAVATTIVASTTTACSGDADSSAAPVTTAPATTVEAVGLPAGPLTAPARPGTLQYNEWLGRTFSDTMLNTVDAAERAAIIEQIVHPGYLQHNPLAPEGRDGLIGFVNFIYEALPDSRFELRDTIATADRVVTRWTWTASLTGAPLFGIDPAGQQLEFDAIDVWTVRDGQLYEHWDQFDWPRALIQLGVEGLPAPFVDVAARPVDR
jgi:predicted ester cyclase